MKKILVSVSFFVFSIVIYSNIMNYHINEDMITGLLLFIVAIIVSIIFINLKELDNEKNRFK